MHDDIAGVGHTQSSHTVSNTPAQTKIHDRTPTSGTGTKFIKQTGTTGSRRNHRSPTAGTTSPGRLAIELRGDPAGECHLPKRDPSI